MTRLIVDPDSGSSDVWTITLESGDVLTLSAARPQQLDFPGHINSVTRTGWSSPFLPSGTGNTQILLSASAQEMPCIEPTASFAVFFFFWAWLICRLLS